MEVLNKNNISCYKNYNSVCIKNTAFNNSDTIKLKNQNADSVSFSGKNKDFDYSLDDGKISFKDKAKNFFKGVVSPITNMFSSPKNFFKGALMVAGAAALCVATGGAAAPVLVAAGVVGGGIQFAKGAYKAATAKTDEEAKAAWQGIGAGTSTVAMSIAGAKASVKAAGIEGADSMSALKATAACFKNAKACVTNSINAFSSGKAAANLTNALNKFKSKPTEEIVAKKELTADEKQLLQEKTAPQKRKAIIKEQEPGNIYDVHEQAQKSLSGKSAQESADVFLESNKPIAEGTELTPAEQKTFDLTGERVSYFTEEEAFELSMRKKYLNGEITDAQYRSNVTKYMQSKHPEAYSGWSNEGNSLTQHYQWKEYLSSDKSRIVEIENRINTLNDPNLPFDGSAINEFSNSTKHLHDYIDKNAVCDVSQADITKYLSENKFKNNVKDIRISKGSEPNGMCITRTATDSFGRTSEYSWICTDADTALQHGLPAKDAKGVFIIKDENGIASIFSASFKEFITKKPNK